MAKKKKQNTYGAIGAIAGLARAGKDAGTVRNKKAPKKERQQARKRLKAYSSGNKSVYVPKQARTTNRQASRQNIQKAQHKVAPRKAPEKKQKTAIERAIEAANQNVARKGMKTTSRMEVYKQKNAATTQAQQAYRNKARAEQEKQAAKTQAQQAKTQTLKAYDDLMKLPYNNRTQKAIREEQKETAKNFHAQYKAAQGNAAKAELDKRLTQIGAKGLVKQQKEVRKSREKIHKEAKRQDRLDKVNAISAEEQSIITKNAMAGTPEQIPEHIRKKKQYQEQKQLDRADSFRAGAYGFINDAMPFSSYVKELEKRYGIKLDDTKLNDRTAFKVGKTAGFLGASMLTGAPVEKAAVKVGTKILQKAGKKAAANKAAKAVVKVGADVASGLPMNIADSAKNSDNLKDFGKSLAKNTVLDIGASGAFHGAGAAVKKVRTNRAATALVKVGKGQVLSEAEQKSLKKVAVEVLAKKATGREETMTATHKAVAKALESGKLQAALGNKPQAKTAGKSAKVSTEAKTIPSDFSDGQRKLATKAYVKYADKGNVSAYNDIVTRMEAKNKGNNVRLASADIDIYDSAGNSKAVHKKAKTKGQNVLTNSKEISAYIHKSLNSDNSEIKAYAKTGTRFIADVLEKTGGEVDLKSKYIELPSDKIRHSKIQHSKAKEPGDLPLTDEDFYNLADYMDDYDDVLEVVRTGQGVRIKIGKKVNGYSVITEMVSEGRNSVKFNNMWKVETEKYVKEKEKVLRYQALSQALPDNSHLSADGLSKDKTSVSSPDVGPEPTALEIGSSPDTSIPDPQAKSNPAEAKTAKKQAGVKPSEVRKTVHEISDREIQTHAINLMNSDTVSDDVKIGRAHV